MFRPSFDSCTIHFAVQGPLVLKIEFSIWKILVSTWPKFLFAHSKIKYPSLWLYNNLRDHFKLLEALSFWKLNSQFEKF